MKRKLPPLQDACRVCRVGLCSPDDLGVCRKCRDRQDRADAVIAAKFDPKHTPSLFGGRKKR